ncbi:hypothetical protein GCM10027048_12630 [Hymenobacter coalescens]
MLEVHATGLLQAVPTGLSRNPGAPFDTARRTSTDFSSTMKSLLQFFLLIALVIVGKQVKEQSRAAVASNAQPVRQHVESMQSFFVQHVSYKAAPGERNAASEYNRKATLVSLN